MFQTEFEKTSVVGKEKYLKALISATEKTVANKPGVDVRHIKHMDRAAGKIQDYFRKKNTTMGQYKKVVKNFNTRDEAFSDLIERQAKKHGAQ